MKLLSLYEEVLSKLLKDNDLAWMKLNLDVELKGLNSNYESNADIHVAKDIEIPEKAHLRELKETIKLS